MTDQLYFDTDCISSFLWVNQENLILQLYPGKIILPQDVYNELSHPSIPHLRSKLSSLKSSGDISTMSIMVGTEAFKTFHELSISPPKGKMPIGKGEAAALALAKEHNGVVASNNLRDIKQYVTEFGLSHITTCDILVESYNRGLIDQNQGDQIWINMIRKRRLLPTPDFTTYLSSLK